MQDNDLKDASELLIRQEPTSDIPQTETRRKEDDYRSNNLQKKLLQYSTFCLDQGTHPVVQLGYIDGPLVTYCADRSQPALVSLRNLRSQFLHSRVNAHLEI